jgi:membrane dipeptidase
VRTQLPDSPRAAALRSLRKEFGLPETGSLQVAMKALPPERRSEYTARVAVLDRELPAATVTDVVDHIDYAVTLIGIDHVGISSDFDGGGGVWGWNNAGETFNVTLELVRRGYTEAEIAKLWSGNLLRVMAEVEKTAR